MEDRIEVARIEIFLGPDPRQQGRMVGVAHTASETKKLYVVSGRHCRIKVKNPTRGWVVQEIPIGPWGWEYDPLDEPA